ncbi:MAG: DMT family transporter [Rhodospirillales bacterium]|nr:DMT family transporter [Rhodospirillales bacterium]
MTDPQTRKNVFRASLWMIGTLISFTAMAVSVRELSDNMSTFQLLFFRSVVGLIVISILLFRSGWVQIRSKQLGLQILRNIIHYGGQFGWFVGISLIPLAEVFAIEYTVPIWTMIFAAPILAERLTRMRMLIVAIGFTGVLVILRPGAEIVDIGAMAVVGAAICYAMAHVLTKKLSSTDSTLAILFYMTVVQLPLGLIPSLRDWYWPLLSEWPLIVLVGLSALSAHYCLTSAFRLADASVVAPMDFLRLPLAAGFGVFVYNEPVDPYVIAGALIIMAGTYLNIHKS